LLQNQADQKEIKKCFKKYFQKLMSEEENDEE